MPAPFELSFVRTFIIPERQERYVSLLSSSKGREKLRNGLADFKDLNSLFCNQIKSDQQRAECILSILLKNGAPPRCKLISEWKRLDGKEMLLDEALQRVVGLGMGTVIICIPERLAYYEGEGKNERYICVKS